MAQRWQYVTQTFYKRLYHINNGTQSAIHFSGVSDGEEFTCNAEDLDSTPGLGRSPEGGHGNWLQYSCLENPMNRGAWWATILRVAKSWTRLEQLSMNTGRWKMSVWWFSTLRLKARFIATSHLSPILNSYLFIFRALWTIVSLPLPFHCV